MESSIAIPNAPPHQGARGISELPPEVSVVMSVFNDAPSLPRTLNSLLSQQGVAFELIIIDDGSTDESGAILDDYARRDARMRVFHQANTGLTRALIRGCSEARGRYIARQDAGGDCSLTGRLERQLAFLKSNPDIAFCSCGTRFVGPKGELLYQSVLTSKELQTGLQADRYDRIRGPSCHPSTMFPRATYLAVGGYRWQFQVAQDIDLWMRMVETGPVGALPEVLYEATWQLGSVSHLRRRQQVLATKAIIESRRLRLSGQSDQPVLDRLGEILAQSKRRWVLPRGLSDARFYYFVGSILADRDLVAARRYLYKAVISWPLHFKAWWKLLRYRLFHLPMYTSNQTARLNGNHKND